MMKEPKKKKSASVYEDNLRVTELLRKEKQKDSPEELKAQIARLEKELAQARSV